MSQVVLDQQLRAKLNGLTEQVILCDESGKTVGHFIPEAIYRQFIAAWSNATFSDEELAKRRQQPRGRTLAEILQRLERQASADP